MDKRYELLKNAMTRNIKNITQSLYKNLKSRKGHIFLPYIDIGIDELRDLIMTLVKKLNSIG